MFLKTWCKKFKLWEPFITTRWQLNIWFLLLLLLLLLHVATCELQVSVTSCRIQLSDFCWCLGGHSIEFFLFIFEGSASFPTGEEVEIPESSSWNHLKGNLKTLGYIFEFLTRLGVLIFGFQGSGHGAVGQMLADFSETGEQRACTDL